MAIRCRRLEQLPAALTGERNRPGRLPQSLSPQLRGRDQREKWCDKGLILWDGETKTVARLKGRHALALLAHFRERHEWEQEGYAVGEPAWRLSINTPGDNGRPTLTSKIALDPQQTAALLELLEKEEGALEKMAEEEQIIGDMARLVLYRRGF